MIRILLSSFIFIILLSSCNKKTITPSWVRINSFVLNTNEATQGANSQNITDVWVYMDGIALGIYELPCKFPVLAEGEHEFTVFAGIKNNGISSTRMRYPFYTSSVSTETLTYHDTIQIFPSINYVNNMEFAFIEDFESAGIGFVKGPTSDTNMVFVLKDEHPEIVKYGEKCGLVHLQPIDSLYTGSTMEVMNIPKSKEVFLEIDFRNNNSMATGVISGFPDGTVREHNPLIILNPQSTGQEVWKKIYIRLTEDINQYANSSSNEIFLLGALDSDNTYGDIYLDNIKVVHFK
ncbi:hypothetical protein N8987_00380 [Crocinitomix sp.]|nr:hypothetical protein [Crocinitomix sp.]